MNLPGPVATCILCEQERTTWFCWDEFEGDPVVCSICIFRALVKSRGIFFSRQFAIKGDRNDQDRSDHKPDHPAG